MDALMKKSRANQYGAALTEFALLLPIFVAVIYGSLYLTDLGNFKLKAQEVAHYGAWAYATQPLSDYSDESFNHASRFNEATTTITEHVNATYLDLDGANERPFVGAWSKTRAAYLEPFFDTHIRNNAVELLPEQAQFEWANPLSLIGMALNFIGIGTGTESMLSGGVHRIGMNEKGMITAKPKVYVVPPFHPGDAATAQAIEEQAELPLASTYLRESDGSPLQTRIIADSWRIPNGFAALPTTTSAIEYSRAVQRINKRSLLALPGGPIINFLVNLTSGAGVPDGLAPIFGFQPDKPLPSLVSRPYTANRPSRPAYNGQAQRGQIDLFELIGKSAQENGAVQNFETGPLYLDPNNSNASEYLKALNKRGSNFMGCAQNQERGCWE